ERPMSSTAAARTLLLASTLLLTAPALAQHAPTPTLPASNPEAGIYALGESPTAELLKLLGPDVARYMQHVTTLSNPFFEGRAPGTRGNVTAQEYLEFWFRTFGLEPAFPIAVDASAADGSSVSITSPSYRQPFDVGLEMYVEGARTDLILGD